MFSTGVAACDQIKELNFQGNSIPQIWYKTLVKKELKNPKPHLLAINILADIVFWYRPREERDEVTGAVMGYAKRFSGDLLQRSYEQLAEMFGCSKGQATEAIVFLEDVGVVQRVFRTRNVGGVICNNILYLKLNVSRLKELTYPPSTENSAEVPGNSTTGVSKSGHRCPEISGEGMAKFRDTNTESTTKITPESTPSINQTVMTKYLAKTSPKSDGLSDAKLQEVVEEELYPDNQIPYSYHSDKRKMEMAIKTVAEWKTVSTRDDFFKDDFERFAYELLVDCLAEMACEKSPCNYKGSMVSYAKVIDKVNACCKNDGSLMQMAQETIDDYIRAANVAEIHDKRKYMKSVIWNSFSTYRVKFESFFNRDYGNKINAN